MDKCVFLKKGVRIKIRLSWYKKWFFNGIDIYRTKSSMKYQGLEFSFMDRDAFSG